MYEQGYISKSEYDQAVNEQLQYHENTEAQQQKKAYSYFTDMVITDVVNDLQSQLGYSETYARSLVTSGGLSIYATVDKDVQDTMESVFENSSNFPSISEDGVKPQAAMMVVDPKTGHILGVVGGRRRKDREFGAQPRNAVQAFAGFLAQAAGDLCARRWIRD